MRLVHCSVEMGFSAESRLATPSEKVFVAITGKKTDKKKRPQEPGVHVKDEENKVDISWFGDGLKIELENLSETESCLKEILAWLKRIDEVAPIGNVSYTEVLTFWIYPAPKYDFVVLERKYRDAMIVNHEKLADGVSDSSVIFDINKEVGEIHHQSGPMGIKQLTKGYLAFKVSDVPDNFIFLWCSCKNKDVVKYSQEIMGQYLGNIFKYCKLHSDEFEEIWEEIL